MVYRGVLPRPPMPTMIGLLCFSAKRQPPKANALSFFLYFCVDQFESQNEAATSPHMFRPSHVSADYRLIDAFSWPNGGHLKPRTPPPLSLFFDGCQFGAPNKSNDAGGSQPEHTHGGAAARLFVGSFALPLEREDQSRWWVGWQRLMWLLYVWLSFGLWLMVG